MKYDLLVVGGGPAGLTAAIHARARDKSVLVVSNEPTASPLCKSDRVDNYPGLPGMSHKTIRPMISRSASAAMIQIIIRLCCSGFLRFAMGNRLSVSCKFFFSLYHIFLLCAMQGGDFDVK